ncbi:MAG TPA: hypothetical protein VEX86_28660 [Longimicrobium sp.]|nr:hypothetical protein [Longimicrobium sp.]
MLGDDTAAAFVRGAVHVVAPQVQFMRARLPRARRRAYHARVDGCAGARPHRIMTGWM